MVHNKVLNKKNGVYKISKLKKDLEKVLLEMYTWQGKTK